MPRTARASAGGYCYHVLNRGNAQTQIFHEPNDYRAFLAMMAEASLRIPMRIVAYCLMPNHFHLVLWPIADGDLSRWMHWLLTKHVRRYLQYHQLTGHIWQGRFKAFPIEEDPHLLAVIRYVERNPLRAGLVERAERWPWSSLGCAGHPENPAVRLDPGPVPRGGQWAEHVNATLYETEVIRSEEDRIRLCLNRGRPYGHDQWTETTAKNLGLESSLRNRGRPRKG
ncbi:MAG: hypothetical protein ABS79_06105 [Planctomycetes bacterium SCN 63-9]|nr:MAG: hypothetical protein ABS79_06105 [Planctomycetes bacterium SCN 63-9]